MDLFQKNVIVTASNFNVMLVNQLWLDAHGIVRADEVHPETFLYTPQLVRADTDEFQFLLLEGRLQFTPTCNEEREQQLIVDRIGQFIRLLPHTPYTALGLNFVWHYRPPEQTMSAISRRLFLKRGTPLAEEFDTDDAQFGGYYSKNLFGFRLKLSTAPMSVQRRGDQNPQDVLQFSFNFHLDSNSAEQIAESLGRWTDAKVYSRDLTNAIEAVL